MITEKVEFNNIQGHKLAGRLELPTTPPKCFAIFAHCFTCSKDIAAASRISRKLTSRGIGVLRFDFTGIGNSDGDFANTNFTSNKDDLVSAYEYLRDAHEAPRLLVGHSLGGAAALFAAGAMPMVTAVVTIGAPFHPEHVTQNFALEIGDIQRSGVAEVTLGLKKFKITKQFLDDLDQQNAAAAVRALGKDLLVMHSPQDRQVDINNAADIYQNAKHPKSFISLNDADHLLSNREDSEYVAIVLAAWAQRAIKELRETADQPVGAEGEVLVTEQDGLKQNIRVGRHQLIADEPTSIPGGLDRGPAPYDLLLAGLGACTSMTMRMYAERKNMPLTGIKVHLQHQKIYAKDCEDCETKTGKIDQIDKRIELAGDLSPEQRERLLDIAERCPVNRTLSSEVKIVQHRS